MTGSRRDHLRRWADQYGDRIFFVFLSFSLFFPFGTCFFMKATGQPEVLIYEPSPNGQLICVVRDPRIFLETIPETVIYKRDANGFRGKRLVIESLGNCSSSAFEFIRVGWLDGNICEVFMEVPADDESEPKRIVLQRYTPETGEFVTVTSAREAYGYFR